MKKTILYLLILITLFMDPMLLTSSLSDHSNVIECGLAIVLMFICLILGNKRSSSNYKDRLYFYLLFLFSFFVIIVFYHTTSTEKDKLLFYLQDLLNFIFFIVAFNLFAKNDLVSLYSKWYKLLCLVCGIVVICFVLYNAGIKFLFIHGEVMGYSIAQIPFICMMHVDDALYSLSRPSWLFAEPSYLGFFLGLQIPLFIRYVYNCKPKGKRMLPLLLYAGAIIVTNSLTCIVASLIAGIFYFIDRRIKINKFLLAALIPVFLIVASTLNVSDYSDNNRIENSSVGNRQIRLVYALDDISQMSPGEVLWGVGKYGYDERMLNNGLGGYANAYLSMLVCYGAVFVLLYLLLIILVFKRSPYEFMFALVAFNSTEISLKTIIFLVFIITYFAYKTNQLTKTSNKCGKVFKNSNDNLVFH